MIKTLLLTDIVDSTALTQEIGDERMSKIWIQHDHIARDLLKEHNGVEADRTDGFLMLFDSVDDASLYAGHLHKAYAELSKKESINFQARIGIHTGEIILIETTEEHRAAGVKHLEVEGIAKPTAARVMSIARGGQTLLSSDAFSKISSSCIKSTSHGHWRMKGVADPIEIYEVGNEATHFHPPADGEKVYRVNFNNGVWEPVKETKNNLTPERDSFIGRKEDLHQLGELVNKENTKLLTLLGPGGTGKTRISKRFARTWLGDYPGGVWFCNLDEATSLEGICVSVAAALDVPLTKGEAVEQLGNAISGRGECLVILDNFEQVTDFAEQTLGQWLQKANKAKFIVTSRNLLNIHGEQSMILQPLPVDQDGLDLFEARAQERKPSFKITDDNRQDVIDIVDTLDGMPLAIELAAARITVFQPRQIKEKLKERFKILAGKKGVSKRQQTLRDAIDWSWDLLEDWEKAAVAQSSVFEGGFTMEAAERVIDLSAYPDAPMTMDVIQTLIEKSLIRTDVRRYDINEPFYRMYQSIHEYCSEKLLKEDSFIGSGEKGKKECIQRHIDYFAEFGTDEAMDELTTFGGIIKAKALCEEVENTAISLKRAIFNKDFDKASLLLTVFWEILNRIGPRHLIEQPAKEIYAQNDLSWQGRLRVCLVMQGYGLSHAGLEKMEAYLQDGYALCKKHNAIRAEGFLLCFEAEIYSNKGMIKESRRIAKKAIDVVEETNHHQVKSRALFMLAGAGAYSTEINNWEDGLRSALEIATTNGNKKAESYLLNGFGIGYYQMNNATKAREYFTRSRELVIEIGNRFNEIVVTGNIGNSLNLDCKFAQAMDYHNQAMQLATELGDMQLFGAWLGNLSATQGRYGQFEEAKEGLKKSISIIKERGNKRLEFHCLMALGYTLEKSGDYENAIQPIMDVIEGSKSVNYQLMEALGYDLLARIRSKQGNNEEAMELINKALEISSEKKSAKHEALCRSTLAGIHVIMKNYKEALAEFEKADPNLGLYERSENQIGWAEALLLSGKKEKAREKLDEFKEISKEFELAPESIMLTRLREVEGGIR